jgi:hypothetical protein
VSEALGPDVDLHEELSSRPHRRIALIHVRYTEVTGSYPGARPGRRRSAWVHAPLLRARAPGPVGRRAGGCTVRAVALSVR